jgi:hypothetical protein
MPTKQLRNYTMEDAAATYDQGGLAPFAVYLLLISDGWSDTEP